MPDHEIENQAEQIESLTQNEYDIDFLCRQEERIKELTQNLANTEKQVENINSAEISQNDINNLIALNDSRININRELESIGRNLDIYCGKFFYYNQLEETEDRRKELGDKSKALQLESENHERALKEICDCLKQLLQSLRNEVETLRNVEKQKFSGPVNAIKRLIRVGGHATENYQNLGNLIEQIDAQLRMDDFPTSLNITDIISSIESTAYTELKQQIGSQETIDSNLQEIQEAQGIYQTTRRKVDRNSADQNEAKKLLEEQSQTVRKEAEEYIRQLQEGKEKLSEDHLLQNWLEQIEKRKEVVRIFSELGVDQESEKLFLESATSTKNNAVNLGRKRSFYNIRDSVRLYLENKYQKGAPLTTRAQDLKNEIRRIQDHIVISYNRSIQDAMSIFQAQTFKTIRDFDEMTQDKKAREKFRGSGLSYLDLRKKVENELGWQENDRIFSLAVDDPDDEISHNGSAWQYGGVRFVFDRDAFKDNIIFTESDAINPDGLPYILRDQNKTSSPSKRQIDFKHLPIAKAIFNLSKTPGKFKEGSKDVYYIEAQTNINPFQAIQEGKIKEIVIDPDAVAENRREEVINEISGLSQQHNVPFRILEKQ